MFKIDVNEIGEFKNAVEALGNLIDEGTFSFKKDGISLHALDPSQIAMVIFTMPSKAFSGYSVDGARSVGLNIDNFNKILSRGGKGNRASIYDEENKVVVQFIAEKSKKSFKVPVIDVGAGVEREPKVEHDVKIVMGAGAFKDAVRDIALVSSHIAFEVKGKKLKISASGDNAEADLEFEDGDESIKLMEVKSAAKATFPVQYFEDMVKGADSNTEIELWLKTNAPVKIKYALGNAGFTYYLAPRIDLE